MANSSFLWEKEFKDKIYSTFPKHIKVDGIRYNLWAYGLAGGGYKAGYGVFADDIDDKMRDANLINLTKHLEEDIFSQMKYELSCHKYEITGPHETRHELFARELAELLNRHSKENDSNTPDYILANFLIGCLESFNYGVHRRDYHQNLDKQPGEDNVHSKVGTFKNETS